MSYRLAQFTFSDTVILIDSYYTKQNLFMPKNFFRFVSLLLSVLVFSNVSSQDTTKKHLPIIDVHVHAMKFNPAFAAGDLCPWFLSSMPGADPNDKETAFLSGECAEPLKAAKSDKEFQ